MRCPECERTGQRSKLFMPDGYLTTDMGGSRNYYDEDGHRHSHEVNSSSGQAHCSNGHILSVQLSTKCKAPGCDYGTPQTITLVPPKPAEPEPAYITFDDNLQIVVPYDRRKD
jgi:hypothetical protein